MYRAVCGTLLIADDVRALQTRLCIRYRVQTGSDGMTEGTKYLNHVVVDTRMSRTQRRPQVRRVGCAKWGDVAANMVDRNFQSSPSIRADAYLAIG